MNELGVKVQDSISGFTGITTAITKYLYKNTLILVEPTELCDGKPIEGIWFDEERLCLDALYNQRQVKTH